MDVVISVANNILNKLVDEAILQACYPFRFNEYVKELETEKDNLQSKIQGVLDHAKDASKKTHKVVGKVEKWLEEAYFLKAEVVELQEKTKKRNKMSCLKCCPKLINRYNLAKQLQGKIRKHNEVEFSEFSRLTSLVGMNYFSSQDFVAFDSRKGAYEDLVSVIKDDKIHMIGLCGMGGSGKTTLVKEVGKEAEKFFDKVVFVVVSNTIDVRKIQNEIASQLSLEFKEEETQGRARRLSMRLSSGERFLIILDDIWKKLDFVDIGIPTANNQMGCTTLITTRKFDVCELMNCAKTIHLECLTVDDSWVLFQKHAGLFDNSSESFKDIAQKIIEECCGLPIAIAAVASTLKDRPYDDWVDALKTLGDPQLVDIEEGLRSTYGCLRLSYDNLDNEVAKSFFTLCSVYPEDSEIQIDLLARIGLGLGLTGEIPSYWLRIKVMNKAIKKLIDSCLLLKVHGEDGSHYIKMHDLIRDVALWIAKKENKLIMGQLKEDMIMEDHAVRYLWIEDVDKYPNKLCCPELKFLYVSIYSNPCVTIHNDFFSGTEKLRVLILKNTNYLGKDSVVLQLPILFPMIKNLCCLMLYCWVLGDISFIGSLETLESLTIWGCSFDELPKCIIQQKKLRFLDLCSSTIERNPFEVMGRCSQLEVLYFCGNSGGDWGDQNKNSAKFFDKISTTTSALESYCIHFGSNDEDFRVHASASYCHSFVSRSLYIENFENCISSATSRDMMRKAKTLSLRGILSSCKNIIPDLWQKIGGGMNELTLLELLESDGIECVIGYAANPSQVGFISNLTRLALSKLKNLKTLNSGELPQGLFANLEELDIKNCDSLEQVLTEDEKEIVDGSEYQSYENAFPKLKRLIISDCKKLEYLMPISLAKSLTHLEHLYVAGSDELRSVFGQSLYEGLNLNRPQMIEFSALEYLQLRKMPNIISICPENYHLTWPSLKLLDSYQCPRLNIKFTNYRVGYGGLRQEDDQMISEDQSKVAVAFQETLQRLHVSHNDEAEVFFDVEQLPINRQQINLSLYDLFLVGLPKLRHIWRGPKNSLLLQHLQWLKLFKCGNLKEVFPSFILKDLPQLRELHIEGCDELEKIIEEDDQNVSSSPQLVFPRLVSIMIKYCHKLKSVFPKISTCGVIPNLKALSIEDAPVLDQVFGDDTTHTYQDVTPALKYVVLWKLPLLTSIAPSIAFQNVTHIVALECPKLSLTSSITPLEMLDELTKAYPLAFLGLLGWLEYIVDSYSERETTQQSNNQELTFITSPNFTENVEGGVAECTASENVQIVTSLARSEPGSSTKSINQIMPGSEISAAMPTSYLLPQSISKPSTSNPVDISLPKTPDNETELVNTISTSQSGLKDQQQSLAKIEISKKSVRDLEGQSTQKETLLRENDVKGSFEGSLSSEKAEITSSSTDSKLASLLPRTSVTSSTNTIPHIQSQIEFNPRKSDVEKDGKVIPVINPQDLKADDLINMLQSMEDDYGRKSPVSSVPAVAAPKDELVAKALADLEDCLKMPLKDIATSEAFAYKQPSTSCRASPWKMELYPMELWL